MLLKIGHSERCSQRPGTRNDALKDGALRTIRLETKHSGRDAQRRALPTRRSRPGTPNETLKDEHSERVAKTRHSERVAQRRGPPDEALKKDQDRVDGHIHATPHTLLGPEGFAKIHVQVDIAGCDFRPDWHPDLGKTCTLRVIVPAY
jgi:hypothetical protein